MPWPRHENWKRGQSDAQTCSVNGASVSLKRFANSFRKAHFSDRNCPSLFLLTRGPLPTTSSILGVSRVGTGLIKSVDPDRGRSRKEVRGIDLSLGQDVVGTVSGGVCDLLSHRGTWEQL